MFETPDKKASAIAICGADNKECLFDIASTGNEDVGAATAASQAQFVAEAAALGRLTL